MTARRAPARTAAAPPRPALRAVPRMRTRRRRARVPFLLVAAVLVGGLVFAIVALQIAVSQGSFEMQRLARTNAALAQRAGELRLQTARLSSPDRIAQEAARLGLQLPTETHTIIVPARDASAIGARSSRGGR